MLREVDVHFYTQGAVVDIADKGDGGDPVLWVLRVIGDYPLAPNVQESACTVGGMTGIQSIILLYKILSDLPESVSITDNGSEIVSLSLGGIRQQVPQVLPLFLVRVGGFVFKFDGLLGKFQMVLEEDSVPIVLFVDSVDARSLFELVEGVDEKN